MLLLLTGGLSARNGVSHLISTTSSGQQRWAAGRGMEKQTPAGNGRMHSSQPRVAAAGSPRFLQSAPARSN